MEFICYNCPNQCHFSYTMNGGAMVPGEGHLCPKGMIELIKSHLPINQRLKDAKKEQQKVE